MSSYWPTVKPPEAPITTAQPWPQPPKDELTPSWPPLPVTPQPISATVDAATIETMRQRLELENLPLNGDGILMLWERTKVILTNAKADEMAIRKVAVKVFIPTPTEGMNTVELGGGYELKAGVNFSYTLDSDVAKVSEIQSAIAGIGNFGPFVAANLFKWSCDLVLGQYRELEKDAADYPEVAEMKRLVDSVLTKTDKAPTLEVKPPKETKKKK